MIFILERFAPKATKININIDENEFTHTIDFFDYNLKGTAEVALDLISKVKLDINLIFKWKEFNVEIYHLMSLQKIIILFIHLKYLDRLKK